MTYSILFTIVILDNLLTMKTPKKVSDEFYDLLIRVIALLNGGNIGGVETLRILVHSEIAMLSANIIVQKIQATQFLCESQPNGLTIYVENLKLEKVYYCHTTPLIRHHIEHGQITPAKVGWATKVWAERNMDTVERAETGNTVVIPTTPRIRSLLIRGRPVTKLEKGVEIIDRGNGKEFMLWEPSLEAIQKWRAALPSLPPLDLVGEMYRIWDQSYQRN